MKHKVEILAIRVWSSLVKYSIKFGVVGLLGFLIDTGIFNVLRLIGTGEEWWSSPLGAKTISTSIAIIFNWIGNRYWTFREHRRRNFLLELVEYSIVSIGGMVIALFCLFFTHHVLGYVSLLADNLSANVIGLCLGTAFRFVLYRYWVYGHHRADGLSTTARVEEAQRALFEEPTAPIEIVAPRGATPASHPRSTSTQGERGGH